MDQASYGQKPTTGAQMNGRSPMAVKVDNLIRSKLRVSNPYDPGEIADGLKRFYKGATELTRLEESGLPFYHVKAVEPPLLAMPGPSRYELDQAKSDVAKDLDSLLQNQLLKDINPELRGWQSAIDNIIADGSEAAPLSLDPRMRDRAFQARRLLGDYARVARFVGALTPSLNDNYRALARSLDEVASVLVVLMGDALASVGYSGGRFLLQAQASDLQDRRDAVLYGLRNLVGTTQLAYGPGTSDDLWPRGLDSYRQFIDRLDRTGNSDLRALFQEPNLAKLMDDLIARVNVMNADGLRALGATGVLQVQPMRRLIQLGQGLVDPQSPQLAAFLDALLLFVEAFKYSASGYRLIQIARPSIVSYGLYGIGGPDVATRRLSDLVVARSILAVQLDCFLPCQCSSDQIRCQIILDKLLYDVDRAIDALSLGIDPDGRGDPERRAFAYGLIIETLLLPNLVNSILQNSNSSLANAFNSGMFDGTQPNVNECLYKPALAGGSGPPPTAGGQATFNNPDLGSSLIAALKVLVQGFVLPDSAWLSVVTPIARNGTVPNFPGNNLTTVPTSLTPHSPGRADFGSNTILQELCMQEDAEKQWKELLQTLAPSCFRTSQFVHDTTILVEAARVAHALPGRCSEPTVTIPPDIPTSLSGLAFGTPSQGGPPVNR
jgi:hypothetical protein